jgi:glycosyltransferase involved in cell wall biosynthesis
MKRMILFAALTTVVTVCSFQGLGQDPSPVEQAFTRIHRHAVWGRDADGNPHPGPGSTIENTQQYREFIQAFLKQHNIHSVVDIGCGDWSFSKAMDWSGIQYIGYDIVPSIVENNSEQYAGDSIRFIHADAITADLPKADLLLCKDVLQYLPNDDIAQLIKQFSKFSYCLITNDLDTAHPQNANRDTQYGRLHYLDLSAPPFCVDGKNVLTYKVDNNVKTVFMHTTPQKSVYDLTLIGPLYYHSQCKFIPLWIDNLSDHCVINVIPVDRGISTSVSQKVQAAIAQGSEGAGKVSVLLDHVDFYHLVPKESAIKIIISTYEATRLPKTWVHLLNTQFDAVVVTDSWLLDVYKQSGVTTPLFALNPGLGLADFLQYPDRTAPHTPFTFGTSGPFWDRKNHKLLLQAFAEEFGNSPDVRLRILARGGEDGLRQELVNYIEEHNLENVEILCSLLNSTAYTLYLSSLDSYVVISKAEGYSITPREAMAMGIPCIVSDNTGHIPLCQSGLVKAVKSDILTPQPVNADGAAVFDSRIEDVRQALREMYENYDAYLKKAKEGRTWVQRYSFSELKPLYLSLVKPDRVVLGTENKLEPGCLTTTSENLYKKYLSIKK